MTDVRFAGGLHDIDAVMGVGNEALGAFLILVSYAAQRGLRDGVLPMSALRWVDRPEAVRAPLEKHGLASFCDETETVTLLRRGAVWEMHETNRVPSAVRRRVIDRDGACRYCGSTADLTVDHVKPRASGGSNGFANLVAACVRCNSAKNNRSPAEWANGATAKRGMR